MGRVVAIGAGVTVRCYGLAGATVMVAEDAESARQAWRALSPDVVLVILTPDCAAVLAGIEPSRPTPMKVVIEG